MYEQRAVGRELVGFESISDWGALGDAVAARGHSRGSALHLPRAGRDGGVPMNRHECPHCGATFASAYFRNRHEAEADCGPAEETDTDGGDRLDPDETDRDLIEIPDAY